MKFENFSKVLKNVELKKGAILLSREHCARVMFILHEGAVQIKHPEHENISYDKFPIFNITPGNYFGFESYLEKAYYIPNFVCSEDSIVSVYPFASLKKLAYTSTDAFCVMVKRMASVFSSFVSYNNYLVEKNRSLDEYKEKLALLIKKLELPVTSHIYYETLDKAQDHDANEDEREFLEPVNFIKKNPDRIWPYKLFYARDIYTLAEIFNPQIRKETIALLKKNPRVAELIFENLLMEYDFIYKFIYNNSASLDKEMNQLFFDSESILSIIRNEQQLISKDKMQRSVVPIFAFLQDEIVNKSFIPKIYDHVDFENIFMLQAALDDPAEDENFLEEAAVQEKEVPLPKMDDNYEQVEGRLSVPPDIAKYLSGEMKFANEREEYKILRTTNAFFLKSVEVAVKKITGLSNKNEREEIAHQSMVNEWENILLEKGVLNPALIPPKTYKKIFSFRDTRAAKVYTFYNLKEWLVSIVDEKKQPSNNEMGFSFRKYINNEMRTWSTKRKIEYQAKPPLEIIKDKLHFEVQNMVHIVYRIMNESPSSSIFPLAKINFEESSFDSVLTVSKIEDVLEEIRKIDFSVFYRETLFRVSETKNLIIQEEVLPNFIIFPGVGHRVVFWQDIEETKKTTAGRIIIPRYFLGTLRTSIIKALASFRWEICKSVKGAGWTDPIDGGLTGSFTDYITFYKKNINITLEAKQKLSDLIKNKRNNYKAVFESKYLDWIEYEQKGIMRLNSLERDIFFKFLPFSKEICKKLEKIPAYEKLIFRTRNLLEKKLTTSTNVFKKTMDDEGNYPENIQKYMNFLQM